MTTKAGTHAWRKNIHQNPDTRRRGGHTHTRQHETPVEAANARAVGNIVEGEICREAQHDTKGGEHLPHHDQGASDFGGSRLGSINRNSAIAGREATVKIVGWKYKGVQLA